MRVVHYLLGGIGGTRELDYSIRLKPHRQEKQGFIFQFASFDRSWSFLLLGGIALYP